MTDRMTLYGHLAILIMQCVGLYYNWIAEGRRHRWQEEQRNAMASIRSDLKNGTPKV